MRNLKQKYYRHERWHKIIWACLTVITVIVVLCDVFLYVQDRKEKSRQQAIQHTRVVKNRKPSKSKLEVTHRPKRQHWPQSKSSKKSDHYQAQAKQEVNGTGLNPQTKQKLLTAFDGLMPNQQKHVLGIINNGSMSNQDKMAAIKSYVLNQ